MNQTNEILYSKNIFGKVVIAFKSGYKYSCSVDWKTRHTPITKIKRGAIDVTEDGDPFEINKDQFLTDGETMIQFYSIEAVSVTGVYVYLHFNQNYKLKRVNCPDKKYHSEYSIKDSDRYKESASSKISSILKNNLAAFAKGIDQDGNKVSLVFLNGYLYKVF